jgi:chromosome segregation ATPase
MKQINAKDEIEKEELSREILSLNRQKEEARLLETRLKAQIEEMNSNFEKQLELKDKHISDLQASINSKNYQFEARTREMVREIQGLKLELEQAQKERELMVEAEKDINDKRLSELESRLSKMNMENQKYEKQVDELREEHEKLLAEKNEIINELSRRVKLMESSPDSGFRIDSNVLKSLKIYLEDILSKFSKEENINSKYLAQLERFSNLQSEVNKLRLKEQETRNKLIEDYEDKIHRMKSDTDSINKELIDTLEREKETTVLTYENVATDLEILKKMNLDNEDQIRRLIEEKAEISTALKHAEEQLEDQSEVLEVQKKDLQRLRNELDDATMELEKVRNALQEEEGDNIKLLKIFRGAFELMTKKKGSLHALLTSIQREENYKGVTEILTKYKIPF